MELPRLYFAFSISVWQFCSEQLVFPFLVCLQYLHDLTIFFYPTFTSCNIFDISRIDIPKDLKIEACARIEAVSIVFIVENGDNLLKQDYY